jgi:hypothetical protein
MRAVMSGTVPAASAPRLDVTIGSIGGGILR